MFTILGVALGLALGLTVGCASTVAKVLPFGEPVTPESCQKLDVYSIGVKDGEEARREGERFDFWRNDCAGVNVPLDKPKYTQGYQDGLAKYCSCEKGYISGRSDEFKSFQGQYYACGKNEYAEFQRGFDAGQAKFNEIRTPIKKGDDFTADASLFCLKK